jgi:3-hydroxybutyryl-CoA dehydrogenase
MGVDVALVLARGACQVTLVEPSAQRREAVSAHVQANLAAMELPHRASCIRTVSSLDEVTWPGVALVVECVPETLAAKRPLFAALADRADEDAVLASNSSGFPISTIAQGLPGQHRMLGLHFFMPAHLVPLVEVVLGPQTDPATADALCRFMRGCGCVPVLVRKDKPGFLANRLQHALAREAFALIDEGVATPQDVDAAVRFGFGFRYLAAGPVLQRDHAGLDVHCAAAASIYPSLCNQAEPAKVLRDRVAQGKLGMKTDEGFYAWAPESRRAERERYDRLLRQGLELLAHELPPIDRG